MVDIRLGGNNKQLFGTNGELKAGVKKEQIKDGNMKAVFDVVDADKNGVLDSNELEKFKQKIIAEAKDEVLTDKEAKRFFKKENVTGLKKEDIASFLELLSQSSENIESSTAEEKNGEKFIHIKYKDGTKETLNPDKTSQIVSQGPNGETITKKLDKNRQVSEETVVTQDGKSTVTSYKDEKPVKMVTTPKGGVPFTTVSYDENGQPKSSTVKSGSTTENYAYVNGQPQLTSKIENEGVATKEKLTTYKYNSDGTVAVEVKEPGKETSQLIENGKIVSETIKEGSKTTAKEYNENGFEETIVEGDKKTQTAYNSENKKLSQTFTTQGKTYSVEYDGKGGTKIVLGNGESIGALAEKFGCTKEELLKANGGKIRGWAGDEISVPSEISADDKRLQGRQTKEQAIDAYKVVADEIEQTKKEVNARKNITFTNKDYNTYEELAKSLFKREGNSTFSKKQLQQRIEDLKKTNPSLKDGELKGKKITGGVAPEMFGRITNNEKSVKDYKQAVKTREDGKNIADNLYKICDDKTGATDSKEFKAEMQKINPQNITTVLDAYDKVIEKNPDDTSLMDTICSEVTATESSKRQALTKIMDNLAQAAKDAGVSDSDIAKAQKDYQESMDKEFGARLRRTDPKDMKKAVDFLRGAIAAKNTFNVQDMSETDAIKTFNSDYASKDSEAQKTYADARKEEGWTAKVGDSVCGWFGCTTIEEMDKKLGKNAADVKRLAESSANEAEFKIVYKEVFGVEFDKNKIAARDAALGNYHQAQKLSSTTKITGDIMKASNNLDYAGLRNEIKQKFQLDDKTLDSVIEGYAGSLDREMSTDTDKKDMLMRFLESTQENSSAQYRELSKGKTLEQMGKDMELLTKSAFGTNDIVKDVIQFNENQRTTEMVTEAGFEIAGTIALQFVPGLGQLAAAKLAVSAAKWGARAVKVVNYANKTEKAFVAVNKLQNLNKATKIGAQMANAGAATAAVGVSNGNEAKEVMHKTLINMSFAWIGAGSSTVMTSKLASRIMTNFHVQDSALAKEIAEEIINTAGSYGVTKVTGDDYGSKDAFVDIASGIVMARISHIKPSTKVDVKPDVVPAPPAPKPDVKPDVVPTPPAPKPDVKPDVVPTPPAPKPEPKPVPKPDNAQNSLVQIKDRIDKIDNISELEALDLKSVPKKERAELKVLIEQRKNRITYEKNLEKYNAGIKYTDEKITPKDAPRFIHKDSQWYNVDPDAKLVVGQSTLDLNNPPEALKRRLDLLDDGEFVIIGRNDINPNDMQISGEHLMVMKKDGKYVICDKSTNGTKIFREKDIEAYKNYEAFKAQNQSLQSVEYKSLEEKFLNATGGDYALLSKLMTSGKISLSETNSVKNILSNVNGNNKAVLEAFVNNPNGIAKQSSMFGNAPVTQQDLAMLVMFNKSNPDVKSLINNPQQVKAFLDKTETVFSSVSQNNAEIVSAIRYGSANVGGRNLKCAANENIRGDIEKLIRGEDYIKQFSSNDSHTKMFQQTTQGEVAYINNAVFVNDGQKMVQLKVNTEDFRKLFPPVDRFSTHQGKVGTCYLVSTLDKLANSPSGRAQLYQMVGRDSQGFYTLTKNGDTEIKRFNRFPRFNKHMYDKNGLAMIEQGWCRGKAEDVKIFNPSETRIMEISEGGWADWAIKGLFGKRPGVAYNPKDMENLIKNYANDGNAILNFATKGETGKNHDSYIDKNYDIAYSHEYSVKGYDATTNTVKIANPWYSGVEISIPMNKFLAYVQEVSILSL